MQGAASPLPEREVPSHLPPSLPPKAGQEENWKALWRFQDICTYS